MAGLVIEVSDKDFEEKVLKSETPVLVDFWAPWCGPCKSIAPVLDDVAKEYDGKLIIAKMNVDENPMTPSRYNVRGIPNLVFFKNGKVINQVVGAVPKESLIEAVTQALA